LGKFNDYYQGQQNPTDPTSGGGLMKDPYATFSQMTPQSMQSAGMGNRFQDMYGNMMKQFSQGGTQQPFNQQNFMSTLLGQMMNRKGGGGQSGLV
jgi:hypothetical protein